MTARRAWTACLLIVVYLALTLLFTYPLAWHLGTHHVGEAGGDAKVYLWNYWWVKKALFEPDQNARIWSQIDDILTRIAKEKWQQD